MTHRIKVIIGASYGDEGKGLAADYFGAAAVGSTIGVVMNGGPQRGHTVETPDGVRHVFHHFSSSSLNGHPTYCAPEFILNPMVCIEEYFELSDLGYRPALVIHPLCRFTTPFDMLINQILLAKAGVHNSCGMGIWETIVRYESSPYALRIGAFASLSLPERLQYLRRVMNEYMPARLKACGITEIPDPFSDLLSDEGLLRHYAEDIESMLRMSTLRIEEDLLHYKNILFENGQGLLLDGNNPETYEETTPSTTGVGRIWRTIERTFTDADVEVCYVSRSYLTRHGDGPLAGECLREDIGSDIRDITNEPNPFQGQLRYAKITSADDLAARALQDFSRCKSTVNRYRKSLMITHLNEKTLDPKLFIHRFDHVYASDQRDRNGVTRLS